MTGGGPYLLDANVLIALTIKEHEHFDRASSWLRTVTRAGISPVVEGALMRYMVRVGVPASSVQQLLEAVYDNPRIEFWSDSVSYRSIQTNHIVGHRQVTGSYLAALAVSRQGLLATLDEGLHRSLPGSTFLIPKR